ncbi:MAG: Cyclic nucleotide-gated potassium channel [candidate division WS2 bacterium]|uniref:Cyclic nucleotide-gated potassium channel n=1 Tax=Psychracetigena formicireducens TaxID=2986056 RepID=A0A9E2BI46_PSYF1|nr:Cyclic nucleotide-gated potassium channel [Candidatus Psychracetigena formicireducens]
MELTLRICVSNYCTNQCDSTIYIKRLFNPLIFLDLLAVLSFFLPMIIPLDLRFLRIFRLLRLLRSFKIGRYSESLNALVNVLKNEKEELLVIILTIFSLLITASSLMYYVEHNAQPEVFTSIPSALWWGIITLTTVGYGDISYYRPGKISGSPYCLTWYWHVCPAYWRNRFWVYGGTSTTQG